MSIHLEPLPHQDMNTPRLYIALDKNIRTCRQEIGGILRSWSEYVPTGYDPEKPVPLVFSLHGAGGWDTTQKFAWSMVAEREGFIVVYPQSISQKNLWNVFHWHADGPDEIAYLDALYDIILKKYNIDTTRVYLHGQSLGDMQATDYLMERSDRFAAACPSAGPTTPSFLFHEDGTLRRVPPAPMPITRMHGSLDGLLIGMSREKSASLTPEEITEVKMDTGILPGLYPWLQVNGCEAWPKFSVRGVYNAFHYAGKDNADTWFFVIEGGEHNPAPEYADLLYTAFLSQYRRAADGKILKGEPILSWKEDEGGIAVCEGSDMAYVNNRPMKMSGPAIVESGRLFPQGYTYVPADFFAQALGIEAEFSYADLSVEFRWEGHTLECAAGIRSCVLDGQLRMMPLCLSVQRVLYLPFEPVMNYLTGMRVLKKAGVEYATCSEGVLTDDAARILKILLGCLPQNGPAEWIAIEKEMLDGLQYAGPQYEKPQE